ncbi:MAG: CPBP family intramembrane metalloprotease [Chitinophagaceae bacterium]|nr:MAG: CPBP family intramembrane metalloprotease [Chitinophagaceae bacterium]
MSTEIKTALIRVLPFLVILIILLIAFKNGKISADDLGLHRPVSTRRFVYWIVGFFIFILLVESLLFITWLLDISPWRHPLIPSVIRIIGAVILAPVAEEFIFRGLLFNKLNNTKPGLHAAVFLQAFVFVMLHHFTYTYSLQSNLAMLQTLADAVLYGYARHYSRSIFTPIAMHMTGNAIATLERFAF